MSIGAQRGGLRTDFGYPLAPISARRVLPTEHQNAFLWTMVDEPYRHYYAAPERHADLPKGVLVVSAGPFGMFCQLEQTTANQERRNDESASDSQ